MDRTIAQRVDPYVHLVEKGKPRFRIRHVTLATDGNVAPRSASTPPDRLSDSRRYPGNAGLNASVELGSITKKFKHDKGQ